MNPYCPAPAPLAHSPSNSSAASSARIARWAADSPARISVRDSKDPAAGVLGFAPGAFAAFVRSLKERHAGAS
ncbi:DUF397 domain-containing protein [Streptomyces sp. NPDC002250]|uniref:DUF397 domain-containing protein n=1 Tax=Streptomyces sp. NPDC002250 TaxID=3364641 RepID=UPI003693D379